MILLRRGAGIFLLFVCNVALSQSDYAQTVHTRLGTGIAFGSDIGTIGANIRSEIPVANFIDISPEVLFYFKREVNVFEVNVNGQYHFSGNYLQPYALAGINFSSRNFRKSVESLASKSGTNFGMNVGAGVTTKVSKFDVFGEARFVLGGFENFSIVMGILFPLNRKKEIEIN